MRYEMRRHQLQVLTPKEKGKIGNLVEAIQEILPDANGTAVVLLGDLERVAAVYENPCSLLWRDAGALLQTLFLSATAFRLAFCPIGLMGHELIEALGLEDRLVGVGAAMIGRSLPIDQRVTGR
jgi:hypothetical protein